MQGKEGDKKSSADYNEEWQTSDDGYLSRLRHQNVQDREELEQVWI